MKQILSKVMTNPLVAAAAPAGSAETENIVNTIANILTFVQVVGGGLIGLMLALAAYHFIAGGQQSFELGKRKIIGIVIGAGLLFGAGTISAVIKSTYGYTG